MYIGRSLQISGVSCDSTKLRFSDCGYTVHEQDYSFCDQHSGVICAIGRVRNDNQMSCNFRSLHITCRRVNRTPLRTNSLSYHVLCIRFHSHKGFQHNGMLLKGSQNLNEHQFNNQRFSAYTKKHAVSNIRLYNIYHCPISSACIQCVWMPLDIIRTYILIFIYYCKLTFTVCICCCILCLIYS